MFSTDIFLQMVLKVYNIDGSTKMVAIHETMNARDVCILLAERNHQQMGPNWTLVERLSELHLGMCLYTQNYLEFEFVAHDAPLKRRSCENLPVSESIQYSLSHVVSVIFSVQRGPLRTTRRF